MCHYGIPIRQTLWGKVAIRKATCGNYAYQATLSGPIHLYTDSFPPVRYPLLISIAVMSLLLGACQSSDESASYVARVYDATLTQDELASMMRTVGLQRDSADVADQLIAQWVRNELLYHEAQRRGLRSSDEVQRQLRENERTVLINALVSALYDEDLSVPRDEEVSAYFERHQEQLRLRQPYVHVYFAQTSNMAGADSLEAFFASAEWPDRVWQRLTQQYAQDPGLSTDLASTYIPQRHLFPSNERLQNRVASMAPGTVERIEADDTITLLFLRDRAEAGTLPEKAWVADEIRERLAIQARKQSFARQVQRLHIEAESRDHLDIPDALEEEILP